jgi:hypothetical protein
MSLDERLLARCVAAYRAVAAHPSGAGPWRGETVDGLLEERFPGDLMAQRLYRHETMDRVRASEGWEASNTCPVCQRWFPTVRGAKKHQTRYHPPDIKDVLARRDRGESLRAIADAHNISPQGVTYLLRRHTQESAA